VRDAPLPTERLGGLPWRLVEFDLEAPAADAPAITLSVEPRRVSGSSGCNRYFGELTFGERPGEIRMGTIGSTRRMCPEAEMERESRYLRALGHVGSYALVDGELRLFSRHDGQTIELTFAR